MGGEREQSKQPKQSPRFGRSNSIQPKMKTTQMTNSNTTIDPFAAPPRITAPQFPKKDATQSIIAFSINRFSGRLEVYRDFRSKHDESSLFDVVQDSVHDRWESQEEFWQRGTNAN